MLRLALRKAASMLAILFGVTLTTFLLMHAIPGNPWGNSVGGAAALANSGMDATTRRQLDRQFGLDLPWWRQFTRYLLFDLDPRAGFVCGVVCGNLGPSLQQRGRTVQDILFQAPENQTFWESRFGYSVRLVLLATLIAVSVGLALGLVSAARPKSAASRAIAVGLAALVSIPNFVLGLLTIVVLASGLKWMRVLPDWKEPGSWLIPAVVLAIMPLASLARVTRASLLNVLHEDYIRAARARGLTPARLLLVHVLRNALVPILTFAGPTVMEMFTGLLIVENLYAFPGFGREYWRAVLALDYPMILGLTLLYASGIVLVNTVVESVGESLDPRLRAGDPRAAP